jgi:hypothetical protein
VRNGFDDLDLGRAVAFEHIKDERVGEPAGDRCDRAVDVAVDVSSRR